MHTVKVRRAPKRRMTAPLGMANPTMPAPNHEAVVPICDPLKCRSCSTSGVVARARP